MKKQNVVRRDSLFYFGFGVDSMRNSVVCPDCNSLETSTKMFCRKCNARLPKTNLYDLYKSYHVCCRECGNVLSSAMEYCTHCGVGVKAISELCAQ